MIKILNFCYTEFNILLCIVLCMIKKDNSISLRIVTVLDQLIKQVLIIN